MTDHAERDDAVGPEIGKCQPSAASASELAERLERLRMLADVIPRPEWSHLPVISPANRALFNADLDAALDTIATLRGERDALWANEVRMTAVFAAEHARAEALQTRCDAMEGALRESVDLMRAAHDMLVTRDPHTGFGVSVKDRENDAAFTRIIIRARDCLASSPKEVGWEAPLRSRAGPPASSSPSTDETSFAASRQPPPHWSPKDGYDRHPQTVAEWDWRNDPPSPERLALAIRRLNFAADMADPRAPDQMALVLRKDLLDLKSDWIRKNAVFEIWRKERREAAASELTSIEGGE